MFDKRISCGSETAVRPMYVAKELPSHLLEVSSSMLS